MNTILEHFKKPRVLLAVVHATSHDAGLRSAITAMENGADGLFFVSGQDLDRDATDVLVKTVWDRFGGLWLGVNYLGATPRWAAERCRRVPCSGLWTDDAVSADVDPIDATVEFGFDERIYFGGVDFKYKKSIGEKYQRALAHHASYERKIDVVTTSGPATGVPPSLDKVLRFRDGVGDRALALASGVNAGNVDLFLPYVDAFLVGTGIEKTYGKIDSAKVRILADKIHSYNPETM